MIPQWLKTSVPPLLLLSGCAALMHFSVKRDIETMNSPIGDKETTCHVRFYKDCNSYDWVSIRASEVPKGYSRSLKKEIWTSDFIDIFCVYNKVQKRLGDVLYCQIKPLDEIDVKDAYYFVNESLGKSYTID